MDIKIAQLRKMKGVSQQELADYLGVTFQSVSKWETKVTFPDITLLPIIAKYFQVSVDEVLGIIPIRNIEYIPRNTDNRTSWKNSNSMKVNNFKLFWNDDYLSYLVSSIWKIKNPINIIEFCCSDGEFGKKLMKVLPKGSTYTGIDSEDLVELAKQNFIDMDFDYSFEVSDIYNFQSEGKYDLSICHAVLRHMNNPIDILNKMKDSVKSEGLVISIELNREIENVGVYFEGIEYNDLCTAFDWRKLWLKELKFEGRDYAIGFRAPFYMKSIGLKNVDVRMNDKVSFITPENDDYEEICTAYSKMRGWDMDLQSNIEKSSIDFYMSRGYSREEVEKLFSFQKEMTLFFKAYKERLSFLYVHGFLISYGRK